jgi:hypothetical protein
MKTLQAEVERDDAVTFIRVIGEELVNAGMPAGDRTVILANVRKLCAAVKKINQTVAELGK